MATINITPDATNCRTTISADENGQNTYTIQSSLNFVTPPPNATAQETYFCDKMVKVKLSCPKKYIDYSIGKPEDNKNKIICVMEGGYGPALFAIAPALATALPQICGLNIALYRSDSQYSVTPYDKAFFGGDNTLKVEGKSVPTVKVIEKIKQVNDAEDTSYFEFTFPIGNLSPNTSLFRNGPISRWIEEQTNTTFPPFTGGNPIYTPLLNISGMIVLTFKGVVILQDVPPHIIKIQVQLINSGNRVQGPPGDIVTRALNKTLAINTVTVSGGNGIMDIPTSLFHVNEVTGPITSDDFFKQFYDGTNNKFIEKNLVQLIIMFFYILTDKERTKLNCSIYGASQIKDPDIKSDDLTKNLIEYSKEFTLDDIVFFIPYIVNAVNNVNKIEGLNFKDIFSSMMARLETVTTGMGRRGNRLLSGVGSIGSRGGHYGGSFQSLMTSTMDGGKGEDLYVHLARTVPMQIENLGATGPQNMVVRVYRICIKGDVCPKTDDTPAPPAASSASSTGTSGVASSAASPGATTPVTPAATATPATLAAAAAVLAKEVIVVLNKDTFKSGNPDDLEKYISQSLAEPAYVDIKVGDTVQFVKDGSIVNAVICFFKSGKMKYGTTKYSQASNMKDYYNSLKKAGLATVKDSVKPIDEYLSLLNLRGFGYVPFKIVSTGATPQQADILYDCQSDISYLYNGYEPSDRIQQFFTSVGRVLLPASTEFRVGDINAKAYSLSSYMTLRKITQPPNLKPLVTALQKGPADESSIIDMLKQVIIANKLSTSCQQLGPQMNPRMTFFNQKVQALIYRFTQAGIVDGTSGHYNIFKSNNFIRSLLGEKISENDEKSLFKPVTTYDPKVSELLFWFFVPYAFNNPNRGVTMIFQAFADKDVTPPLDLTNLPTRDYKPAVEPDSGGGGAADDTLFGGKWAKLEETIEDPNDPNATKTVTSWYDDQYPGFKVLYRNPGTNEIYHGTDAPPESATAVEDRRPVDEIRSYVNNLLDVLKDNEFMNDSSYQQLKVVVQTVSDSYQNPSGDNTHIFSKSIATEVQSEAAIKDINKAIQANVAKQAQAKIDAAKAAQTETERLQEIEKTHELAKLAITSNASSKGTGSGLSASDFMSRFTNSSNTDINRALGSCGNDTVISCDGQTLRIDIELKSLLAHCANSMGDGESDSGITTQMALDDAQRAQELANAAAKEAKLRRQSQSPTQSRSPSPSARTVKNFDPIKLTFTGPTINVDLKAESSIQGDPSAITYKLDVAASGFATIAVNKLTITGPVTGTITATIAADSPYPEVYKTVALTVTDSTTSPVGPAEQAKKDYDAYVADYEDFFKSDPPIPQYFLYTTGYDKFKEALKGSGDSNVSSLFPSP
jgi:hypothetical protein